MREIGGGFLAWIVLSVPVAWLWGLPFDQAMAFTFLGLFAGGGFLYGCAHQTKLWWRSRQGDRPKSTLGPN